MRFLFICCILLLHFQTKAQTNPTKQDTEQNRSLKILSWNIYMLPATASLSKQIGKTYRMARTKAIVEYVKQKDFDIIVWQEAFHPFSRFQLKRKLRFLYPYQYGPANRAAFPKTNSGITIFSKIKLKLLNQIKYKAKKGIDAITNKGALLLEGKWNKQNFQILGTHLQAGSPNAPALRLQQMQQIKDELLTPFKKENVPQIICGDMNTRRKSEAYNNMIKTFDVETYTLNNTNGSTCRSNKTDNEIDYIFVKNNGLTLQKVSTKMLIPEMKWGSNGEKWLSDHHAIETTIQF